MHAAKQPKENPIILDWPRKPPYQLNRWHWISEYRFAPIKWICRKVNIQTAIRGAQEKKFHFQDSMSTIYSMPRFEKRVLYDAIISPVGTCASSFSADVASQMFVCVDMCVQKGGDCEWSNLRSLVSVYWIPSTQHSVNYSAVGLAWFRFVLAKDQLHIFLSQSLSHTKQTHLLHWDVDDLGSLDRQCN